MKRWMLLPLALAARVSAQAPRKDPGVATVLGIVLPGGGQYYAEEPGHGLLVTAGVVAGVVLGLHSSHGDIYTEDLVNVPVTPSNPLGLEFERSLSEHANYQPLVVGSTAAALVWLFGAIDAPSAARRANVRHRVAVLAAPNRLGLSVTLP